MSAQEKRRKKHFIDREVQGTLVLHIVGHWLFFLFTAGALLFLIDMLTAHPRDVWKNLLPRHGPMFLIVLVLAPIFIRDMCKLSNRFAGPMVKLRRAMRDLADGREVEPTHFRNNDFWKELAVDFNRVVDHVQASSTFKADAPISPDSLSDDESQGPAPTTVHTCES